MSDQRDLQPPAATPPATQTQTAVVAAPAAATPSKAPLRDNGIIPLLATGSRAAAVARRRHAGPRRHIGSASAVREGRFSRKCEGGNGTRQDIRSRFLASIQVSGLERAQNWVTPKRRIVSPDSPQLSERLMNVFRIRSLLLVVLAFLGVGTAVTAQPMPVAGSSRAKANAGTVGIISGGVDGTYVRIAADLAAVLDDGQTLRVLPVIGKGSLQSVADILYLRGIDVGIVQSDVLAYVRQQHLYPGVEQSLQYVAKLYDEEVHVLARKDIARVEDLAGQPVNVDVAGSGTAMTAPLIFDALGVAVQIKNFDQSSALERLKQGELAAIVYVSGQPARLFADVTQESGLHFLALPLTNALAATYLPAGLTHQSYPALVADGAPVSTVAVGSVMVVFAWQQSNERYAKLSRFVDAFFTKFLELLKPPRHPKWKDVNLAAKVPGWTRFGPAQDALAQQATKRERAATGVSPRPKPANLQ